MIIPGDEIFATPLMRWLHLDKLLFSISYIIAYMRLIKYQEFGLMWCAERCDAVLVFH